MGMGLFAGRHSKPVGLRGLGYDADAAQANHEKAKPKYKAIIADLPEFEKSDRFKMNLVNCADDRCVYSLHAGAPKGGQTGQMYYAKIHDDKAPENGSAE